MSFTADDARYMARALELARNGLYTTDPNPRVGCVIVKNGDIVGEGYHQRAGEPHAEVVAIQAGNQQHLYGATAYVTLEPCCHHGRTGPCSGALIKAGVARVVAAMRDPNPCVDGGGLKQLAEAGIEVQHGLMQQEAEALNPGFISRMLHHRPWVRVKLAASLDGRTALENGESKWITSADARADVQRLRARSSAILTGVSTVLHDNPSMNVRELDIGRQPLRVVTDTTLRMPVDAQMLKLPGQTIIATASEDRARAAALRDAGAEVLFIGTARNNIDLTALMQQLAAREVNELHVEAGATLCGGLLRAGLVDELVLYLAPHLLGNHARGLFNLPALETMSERINLEIRDIRAVGCDWRLTATIKK